MMRRLTSLVFPLAGLLLAAPVAGVAQTAPVDFGIGQQTSTALTDALRSRRDAQAARLAPTAEDTPPPPVTQGEGEVIGFPKGITYAFDLSSSFPYGDTGEVRNGLPGGFDASITARVEPRTNAFVDYYQLQPQILGIDSGSAPLFVEGAGKPVGALPLAQLHEGVSTKVQALVIGLQRLFFVGGAAINGGHPIVFAPTYIKVKSDIGGGDLNFQQQFNAQADNEVLTVEQRVYEQYAANLAIPLSLTEKLNVVYFVTGEILNHAQGFNRTNHPQVEQMVLAQYNPNPATTIFFNPSHSYTYFQTDSYPVSTTSFVYGVTHRFGKPNKARLQPFIQGEVITSNPNNPSMNGLGVIAITAARVGNGTTALLPTIGGNKFTTVQLSVGLGSPPIVVPYP